MPRRVWRSKSADTSTCLLSGLACWLVGKYLPAAKRRYQRSAPHIRTRRLLRQGSPGCADPGPGHAHARVDRRRRIHAGHHRQLHAAAAGGGSSAIRRQGRTSSRGSGVPRCSIPIFFSLQEPYPVGCYELDQTLEVEDDSVPPAAVTHRQQQRRQQAQEPRERPPTRPARQKRRGPASRQIRAAVPQQPRNLMPLPPPPP